MIAIDVGPPPAVIAPALPRIACAGETITRIEIHRYAASPRNAAERALAATTGAVGLETDRTRASVIRAYVRLAPGTPCVERDRRESERMLRLQPLFSSAAVTAVPDGPGRVRIRVDVVNEWPWIVGGRVADGGIDALRIGTLDLGGRGRTAVVSAERGGGYRPGVGLSLAQYGAFGRPAVGELELERRPLGGRVRLAFTEPFLTDVQRQALDANLTLETEYAALVRPVGDAGAVRTRRSAYRVGWVKRVGTYQRDRVVGLAGLAFLGSDVRSSEDVDVVSDSGLVATGDSLLVGRFPDYGVSRIAGLGGLRALRFQKVERYDALRAAQDVGTGIQLNLLVAPSVGRSPRSQDVLVAGDLYAGMGRARSFASLSLRAEGRTGGRSPGPWEGVVASSRLSWHIIASERRTRVVSLSTASMRGLAFPAQLTLRDPDGGLIGHPGSRAAGGRRMVARIEERMLLPWFARRADIAVAAFTDAGRVRAGDAPYGADSPLRGSVGLSLLGAFPSGGKRVYRMDLGIPVNPERGGAGLAFRFSVADRTSVSWAEPRDVARARSATGRASFLRW